MVTIPAPALDQQQGNDGQRAFAGAGIAQEGPQGDLRTLPGQDADGMGVIIIEGNLPDIRYLVVDQGHDATHQLARPGVVLESNKLFELGQQGGDQKDADAVGNDSARVHHDVGANGPEKLLVIFVILPHHDKEIGVEGPGRHDNGEVVGIVVGAHHQTHGAPHARLFQCMGLGTPP